MFEPQLIWLIISFAALYVLMSRVALPRVGEVLEERHDRIQRDLDEAERLKGETEKAIADYEKELADARSKAGEIAQQTRDEVNAEIESKKAAMDAELNAKIDAANVQIAAARDTAMKEVSTVAEDTAEALVSELIGQNISRDEIGNYVAKAASKG